MAKECPSPAICGSREISDIRNSNTAKRHNTARGKGKETRGKQRRGLGKHKTSKDERMERVYYKAVGKVQTCETVHVRSNLGPIVFFCSFAELKSTITTPASPGRRRWTYWRLALFFSIMGEEKLRDRYRKSGGIVRPHKEKLPNNILCCVYMCCCRS